MNTQKQETPPVQPKFDEEVVSQMRDADVLEFLRRRFVSIAHLSRPRISFVINRPSDAGKDYAFATASAAEAGACTTPEDGLSLDDIIGALVAKVPTPEQIAEEIRRKINKLRAEIAELEKGSGVAEVA